MSTQQYSRVAVESDNEAEDDFVASQKQGQNGSRQFCVTIVMSLIMSALFYVFFVKTDPFDYRFYQYAQTLALSLTGITVKSTYFVPGIGGPADLTEKPFNLTKSIAGQGWPRFADTMAGLKRMDSNRDAIIDIERNSISGDVVEAGVWRGGSSIFFRSLLDFIKSNRKVWLFDSFAGLPKATTSHDEDYWNKLDYISVSMDEVKERFQLANVSTEGCVFVKGYHCDTFPLVRNNTLHLKRISILRLDSDMWEATMDVLFHVWDRISVGGWVINDDGFRENNKGDGNPEAYPAHYALKEFSRIHQFDFDPIDIDGTAYYFKKTPDMDVSIIYEKYYKNEAQI